MTDLSTVQVAADRQVVCVNAAAAQAEQAYLDLQETTRQTNYQQHFSKIIANWCNVTDVNSSSATEETLTLPINNMVNGTVLDEWQSKLETKGYIVTRENDMFTIQIA